MISPIRTAASPVCPASRDTFPPAERTSALRITLCPSATLLAMLVCSLIVATAALWATLAPWIGGWHALPATLAFAAAGALRVASWHRAQPRVVEIGPDGIRAYSDNGARLAGGSLTGCSQWGTSLLVLAIGAARSRRMLFIAADAVSSDALRELAVRGRCAAGR
ncbi:MAG TPA: hypothetical protein VGG24_07825 [Paraburkholderia sp.]